MSIVLFSLHRALLDWIVIQLCQTKFLLHEAYSFQWGLPRRMSQWIVPFARMTERDSGPLFKSGAGEKMDSVLDYDERKYLMAASSGGPSLHFSSFTGEDVI